MNREVVAKVKRILKNSTKARNCDSTLFARYLMEHSRLKTAAKSIRDSVFAAIVLDIPTGETITRIRRKVQEDGCYEANDKTKKKRNQQQGYCRANFRRG